MTGASPGQPELIENKRGKKERRFFYVFYFFERERNTPEYIWSKEPRSKCMCVTAWENVHMFCVFLTRWWVIPSTQTHTRMHPLKHAYTHTHTHIYLLPRLHGGRSLGLLIISPAERGLQQGTVIFTSWCEFSHLSYVHIIHIWSHLPSRSNAISSLTSWNVMSHWTKFCSSVNYGPVSAALSMAT